MRRSFLALQGTASPFFGRLAAALVERRHAVKRVNFCGGDFVYRGQGDALDYQGRREELPSWYTDVLSGGAFTDILMFGDCREIHRPVHAIAASRGVAVHVFEEGYVRPHWLTLERSGVNGRSSLPRDPEWYRAERAATPAAPPALTTGYNLFERAFHDIRYRHANMLYSRRYPHYRSHRPRNGLVEYAGLATRALQRGRFEAVAESVIRKLVASRQPYFVFPLQLNSDAQIVVYSPFDGIREAINRVMTSFAQYAPSAARLVIKNHPLDTGLIDYRRVVFELARELGIGDRLDFINGGHLPTLLENAAGVVVVNSTVGLSAIHHQRPLATLGTAIYDLPGMTWQDGLDTFWQSDMSPDMDLYRAFLDYVIHHTQINGDFYTRTGIEMAVRGAVERLERTDA
ncbi:capsule biosynthesis protein [Burkholderia cepacia]|uniref:capsule biosynthesis protein n=1 Tax=Burkholderia cepacia TaxID=292 RepID=UPI000756E3CE|nr:capsular biosynthesis protein [Burkholderia cepacia]KWC77585.1 capsular biosynthesis protein [Burkholderia cepacia]KWH54002.1 capsular biosynthesis protein [Burkholderia cepacia]UIY57338.1 capsular biosynthesis protein [Burkholderia cepacia]